jgi:hypothetical protein
MTDTARAAAAPCELTAEVLQTPECERFRAALQSDVWDGLTRDQQLAIARALRLVPARHWIDLKSSFPLPTAPVYVRLLVGRERRNPARLKAEGQRSLASQLMIFAMFAIIMAASASAAVLLAAVLSRLAIPDLGAMPPLQMPLR